MFTELSSLNGYSLSSTDGEIGTIVDTYFDDDSWSVRYFVVDTGSWLTGRRVLVSPLAISEAPDADSRSIATRLSRSQIEQCPDFGTHLPLVRQKEQQMAEFFQWDMYWKQATPVSGTVPPLVPPESRIPDKTTDERDASLRSCNEICGYSIHATDGEIGHVEDFLMSDAGDWSIAFMLVDTKNWLPGKIVLIDPQWIVEYRWDSREALVSLSRARVENAPQYEPPLTSDTANRHREHYGDIRRL